MAGTKGTEIAAESVHDMSSNSNSAGQRVSRVRQLDRYISLKPIVSFGLTLQASWEAIALTFQASMYNGGPVTLVYGMIIATIGSLALAASLGEMASIDPTVGAQYRWTALYTPRKFDPKFWSLLQGWLTTIAWLAACALTPFLMGTIVQAMAIFNNPTYVPERWHASLIMWGFVFMAVVMNIYARRILVVLEMIGGVCHLIFFFCVLIVLLAMGSKSSNAFVWTNADFVSMSGWTNPAASFCIGLLSPVFSVSGFDGILHMSDEVQDAPSFVPRSMVYTVLINGVFAFAFIVALLYRVGDLETVLASPTGLPIIEVFYQATKSTAATNVFLVMLLIIVTIGNFGIFASVSRLTWAFASNRGLPWSDFFSYVHPTLKVPIPALGLVSVFCCLVALINIGSTTAFLAVLSLSTLSLYISYLLPILFLLIRKVEGRHPVYGPFSLGRWGIPINLFALLYGCYMIVFMSFPTFLPVTKSTMNYAAPIWLGCLLIALADWFVSGHERFSVPGGGEPVPMTVDEK